MELPQSKGVGPTWQVSVSDASEGIASRPSEEQKRLALCAFDMLGTEEDNHHPGNARHFFQPCDPAERVDCECKTTETQVTDPDGYRWSNTTDGSCRGCELAKALAGTPSARPCPLHDFGPIAPPEPKSEPVPAPAPRAGPVWLPRVLMLSAIAMAMASIDSRSRR